MLSGVRIESLTARPLSVPLAEPFVIASGRLDATRAVEIEARVGWRGEVATGIGEAACLPPVTREDQDDVLRDVAQGTPGPVARAGIESAVYDAMARIARVPLRTLVGGDVGARTRTLETDVTIAIADAPTTARLAREWTARGFRFLKVKVGRDLDADARALEAIARAAPHARLRIDANAGYAPKQVFDLARACDALGLHVDCWEQPCATEDLDAMAEVARALETTVVADESCKSLDDVRAIVAARAADGVNLKLAKLGGVDAALEVGRAARAAGLKLMIGGMVETRLGMTAAAHVACALGGCDYVDLDTAWLLAQDPYEGGYVADGPRYTMPDTPGLGVTRSPAGSRRR